MDLTFQKRFYGELTAKKSKKEEKFNVENAIRAFRWNFDKIKFGIYNDKSFAAPMVYFPRNVNLTSSIGE